MPSTHHRLPDGERAFQSVSMFVPSVWMISMSFETDAWSFRTERNFTFRAVEAPVTQQRSSLSPS